MLEHHSLLAKYITDHLLHAVFKGQQSQKYHLFFVYLERKKQVLTSYPQPLFYL